MKNKKQFKSALNFARHSLVKMLWLGAVIMMCSSAPAQNLFVSDGESGLPHILGHIYEFTPLGARSTFASGLDGPEGLAFDSAGNLFVAFSPGYTVEDPAQGHIDKFTPGGARITFASGLVGPGGLAFDSAGNLFVSDNTARFGSNGNIYKFTPQGARSTFASGLSRPFGLAFDGAGNLFVADVWAGNIYKFTPQGVRSTFASGLSRPFDLAFDGAGNLFVTTWGIRNGSGGNISKFTPEGVRSTFADFAELGAAPEGLAFDSAGNLFVFAVFLSGTPNKIFKFTAGGVRSTFAEVVGLGFADEIGFLAFQPTQTFQQAQLLNISTRLKVLTGDNVLIGGFIISGSDNKEVLLRALGPALSQFGMSGVLTDPTLELHDGTGAIIASNDNWKDSQQAAIAATGKAPPNALEPAILRTLAPGNYTIVVRGKNAATGMALVEAYDLTQGANASLSNSSARGFVDINEDVMIGGFITGNGYCKVIVRALGPTLAQFGVPNVLADPTLELHDVNGTVIASNNNWQDTQGAEIQASGFAPPNTAESAVIINRLAGNTTAIVRGKNNTTGNALVEVYTLPP